MANNLKKIMDHVERLGKRKESFLLMLDHLFKRPDPFIVETGCMRQADNYEGDGMSTLLWSNVTEMVGGRAISFDVSPDHVAFARSLINNSTIGVICQDSVLGIKSLTYCPDKPIDLLYLDSVDLELPDLHKSFIHNMFEFTTALPLLKPGSLICVDDNIPFEINNEYNHTKEIKLLSKGEYLKQYLEKIGIKPIHEDYQIVWRWV